MVIRTLNIHIHESAKSEMCLIRDVFLNFAIQLLIILSSYTFRQIFIFRMQYSAGFGRNLHTCNNDIFENCFNLSSNLVKNPWNSCLSYILYIYNICYWKITIIKNYEINIQMRKMQIKRPQRIQILRLTEGKILHRNGSEFSMVCGSEYTNNNFAKTIQCYTLAAC